MLASRLLQHYLHVPAERNLEKKNPVTSEARQLGRDCPSSAATVELFRNKL